MTKFLTLFGLISTLTLCACFKSEWIAFVYPNAGNLTVDENIGSYSSLEDCRQAVTSYISAKGYDSADYECGLNCDVSNGKPYVCEKTEK